MNKENKKQMNLKEKKIIQIGKYELESNSYMYKMSDVKEAVLKFKTELNKSGQWGLNKDNALKKYNKIFGDFEK